jgi:acyl-CoA synthetase (AMP-forming)/AMP-acid ligase II
MSGVPLIEAGTFWDLIERRAAASPDALFALDDRGALLTFAGYRDACLRAAAGLHARGVGEGTPVSWVLPTRLTSMVLAGALSRLSAIQNPIVPIYRHREVGFVTRQTGARLLVLTREFRGFDYLGMARELARDRPEMELLVADAALPEGDPAGLPPAPSFPSGEAPVRWIFYTSGTTAAPKGARHTDETLLVSALAMTRAMQIRPDDRIALVFPVAHLFGPGWMIGGLAAGSAHLVVEHFDPPRTIPFLAEHGVTQAAAGTAFHQAYLAAQREQPEQPLFPRVRAFPGGGAPKPPQLHYDLIEEMGGAGIVSGYGLTECPVVSIASPTDPSDKLACFEGRVNPDVEIRVVRSDGRLAGPSEEGELRVRGPQLCRGYVDAELNSEAFDSDGFFRTGDLGFVDASGYVAITGRLKDVIIRNGENISAKELEDVLYEHPKVADVAVIGLPDPRVGERVCAVVQSEDGAPPLGFDEMVEFLLSHKLMKQKLPEQLELVDRVPRNPSGKILKNDLRERFAPPPA